MARYYLGWWSIFTGVSGHVHRELYGRKWNIRVSAVYFLCMSWNNLKHSRSWGTSHDTENVMSGMELLLLVFPAMYIDRNLWEKMKHHRWAVHWNDVWNSAILLSVALHLCLLYFRIIGFSFHFFYLYFYFTFLKNLKCCLKYLYIVRSQPSSKALYQDLSNTDIIFCGFVGTVSNH